MKPKVLFVAPVATIKGGAEFVLLDMVRNPAINATVAVPARGELSDKLNAMNIDTIIIDFGQVNLVRRPFNVLKALGVIRDAFAAARAIRSISRAQSFHIVHSNGLKAHVLCAFARLMRGKPLVVHTHDIPFTRQEKWVWRFLASVATRVLIVSSSCWPFPKQPGHVVKVANGIDIAHPPIAQTKAIDRSAPIALGFVGRIHPFKGLDLLLTWLDAARSRGLIVTLSIRGEGEPDYVAQLKTRVDALNLNSVVTFEGKRAGLDAIYSGVDCLIVPSNTPEPFGLVALEAMLLGIPVIAYPSGGLLDIIDHGETGYFARDASEFIHALEALTEQPTWDHIRTAARASVEQKFSRDAFYQNINAVYRTLA